MKRLVRAFFYSLDGFKTVWRNETAFRQEVWTILPFLPLALFLPLSLEIRLLLIILMLLVIVAELFNSAIEAVVDLFTSETHHLAKRAKDAGSAAVLLTLILAICTWVVVLVDLAIRYQQSILQYFQG
jgi:diacylglycerol kinase (ATP)